MEPLDNIRARITDSQGLSTLCAKNVTLLGASKGQTAEHIESFIHQGLSDFGENRVQEAQAKWPALKQAFPHITLHLIGPLQTNKVGDALELFDVIQTLDRPKLAEAIARIRDSGVGIQEKQFYIQVNTGEEPQKAGIAPNEATDFIRYCAVDLALPVAGLMCIPPAEVQPAPHFALLRKLALNNGLTKLSMGMSDDFETAIRMGSTCVRVGRALFGERA